MEHTSKADILDILTAHVESECKAIDREQRFDDMLDECYSFEKIGGPFENMLPSRVLKEVDPIAYRCGVNDYEDCEGWVEIRGDYYEQDDAEEAKATFIEDHESAIAGLESEIEEMEADEAHDISALASLQRELAERQADLIALNKHSF